LEARRALTTKDLNVLSITFWMLRKRARSTRTTCFTLLRTSTLLVRCSPFYYCHKILNNCLYILTSAIIVIFSASSTNAQLICLFSKVTEQQQFDRFFFTNLAYLFSTEKRVWDWYGLQYWYIIHCSSFM